MDGDWTCCVNCYGFGLVLNKQSHRRHISHGGEDLSLKAVENTPLNLSNMYCSMMGRFSVVGAHGSTGVSVGGGVRVGQEQGLSSGPTTPVFVHLGQLGTVIFAATFISPWSLISIPSSWVWVATGQLSFKFASGEQEPNSGKEEGMAPRS